jgi:hypothetical protein
MMTVPGAIPDTIPVLPTVAIDVLLLLHTPPGAVLLSAIVAEVFTTEGPVIVPATGRAVTVTIVVAAHPPGIV